MVAEILNTRRFACMVALFCLLFTAVLGYVFYLQIVKNSFFSNIGKRQYQIVVTRKPPRASIVDRNGRQLAFNKDALSAFVTPNNLSERDKLSVFLKKEFPSSYERLKSKPKAHFLFVKRHLSDDEVEKIRKVNLADIHFVQEQRRFYTLPSLGHTIGVTDIDNRGLSGIELMYDKRLSGMPVTYRLEKDARLSRYYFSKETEVTGVDGQEVRLTIDSDIQFLTYDLLKAYVEKTQAVEGMALVMDPGSGDLLALACYPDFDPNGTAPKKLEYTKNRIFTEVHEFGSVMKIFPALAALDEGVVKPDEIIDCEGRDKTYIRGIPVTTWRAFGKLTYAEVISNSNNIGTTKVILRLEPQKVYEHLTRCGFGSKTGLGFLGEQKGSVPHPSKWSLVTPSRLSFGYEISSTLLHLGCGFSIIANKGYGVTPRLLLDPAPEISLTKRLYRPEPVEALRSIITLVPTKGYGTLGCIPGYTILGKTGSAYLLTNGAYDKKRSLYTFAGIVEKGDYRRVVVLVIREPPNTSTPTYASTVAVPLFREIVQQMLIRDRIAPDFDVKPV